jgi:monofunctional glycosyltransferase
MFIRLYEQWKDDKDIKLERSWVSFSEISKNVPLAAVSSEDQNFFNHSGFDFEAIEKALENNKKGKKVRGASTISQQTAKNVFLWPGRSWIRKGFEVYFTALIELFWGKERIMEVYLNIAEMGEGLYGIESAAQKYFNKPASKLSKNEAALIVACLPSPQKWKANKPGPYVVKRQQWILGQMRNIEPIVNFSE